MLTSVTRVRVSWTARIPWVGWRGSSTHHSLRFDFRRATMSMRIFAISVLVLMASTISHAERIKDMAQVQGVRTNQLIGYGLVVGLHGTGDQTSQAPFTIQSLTNMLAQLGVTVPTNVTPQLKNVAAVSVHAVMPAFVKPGETIDIT